MNSDALKTIIRNGKIKEIIKLLRSEFESGEKPESLINVMTDEMKLVGDRFQNGEIKISDMLSSAMTMKKGITFVTPLITDTGADYIGKAIVGIASGDLHDLGKGLVSLMLESFGFKVIDLGIDVHPQSFADALTRHPDCKILTVSATLDSSIPALSKTIEHLKKTGQRDGVKIIVGGAAVTSEIADKIGADAYAPTATSAAIIAKEFTN